MACCNCCCPEEKECCKAEGPNGICCDPEKCCGTEETPLCCTETQECCGIECCNQNETCCGTSCCGELETCCGPEDDPECCPQGRKCCGDVCCEEGECCVDGVCTQGGCAGNEDCQEVVYYYDNVPSALDFENCDYVALGFTFYDPTVGLCPLIVEPDPERVPDLVPTIRNGPFSSSEQAIVDGSIPGSFFCNGIEYFYGGGVIDLPSHCCDCECVGCPCEDGEPP